MLNKNADNTMTMNIKERIERAKTNLVVNHPFFGALLCRMPIVEDSSIPTMCTNGITLWYNPEFAASLKGAKPGEPDELTGVLVHEVMHPACGHPWRCQGRDMDLANQAADYVINHEIREYIQHNPGCFALPPDHLWDAQYAGKSMEVVYAELANKNQPPQPQPPKPPGDKPNEDGKDGDKPGDKPGEDEKDGGGIDKPGDDPSNKPGDKPGKGKGKGKGGSKSANSSTGEFVVAPKPNPSDPNDEARTKEAEWAQALHEAAMTAKAMGKGGPLMDRIVGAATKSELPWEDMLRSFMADFCNPDYNWMKPDRRFLDAGIYLPDLGDESVGELVFAVDTSGSVNTELLTRFVSEAQSAMETVRPRKMHLMYFDHQVNLHEEYEPGDSIVPKPVGGGGTDFAPIFRHIEANDITPLCVVVLTDLMGSFPTDHPTYPVVWCAYGGFDLKAPFGDTVKVLL